MTEADGGVSVVNPDVMEVRLGPDDRPSYTYMWNSVPDIDEVLFDVLLLGPDSSLVLGSCARHYEWY